MTEHHFQTFAKGIVGTISPILGLLTSMQQHLEWGLRVASLLVGIGVGVVTIWSMVRRDK